MELIMQPVAKLCALWGTLIRPLTDLIPDNVFTTLIAAVIAVAVWFGLRLIGNDDGFNLKRVEFNFKLQMTWLQGAFLVGYLTPLSGEHCGMSFLGHAIVEELEMTLFNVAEWESFPQLALLAMLFGMVFCGLVYGIFTGALSMVRVLAGFPAVYFVGKALMALRVALLLAMYGQGGLWYWLYGLLRIAFGLLDVLPVILLPIFFVVFITPHGWLKAFNKMNEEREVQARKAKKSPSEDHLKKHGIQMPDSSGNAGVPVYVTDDSGNHYPVELRGDFIYIMGPNGELSTKWEYIKGQSYFNLSGKRFHIHY